MICIPITAGSTREAIEDMRRAEPLADLIEIRADYIKTPDLDEILGARKKPVIVTITPQEENGRFEGTETERIALLKKAVKLGAEYIDVSLDCPELGNLIKDRDRTKVIVSYHNYQETPRDLSRIYSRLEAADADIIKIATFANKLSDNQKVLDLAKKSNGPTIAVCMGPKGEISRILALLFGSYLTFASLASGKESAPGQIPATTLRDIYRIKDIRPGCSLYGLIGNPVNKSKGYLLFNSLFKEHDHNSMYLNFLVDDMADFAASFMKTLSGFSVTMPHKQEIMPFLDAIDPAAEKIGAVNTVTNTKGKLTGYNTDMPGALTPISERTEIKDKAVTLLGAGGAARAIAVGIMEAGGKLTILNRTVAKAEKLAADLNCRCGPISDFPGTETDILINMTSVGMHPQVDAIPVSPSDLKNMVVFDGIYNPVKTRLLEEAERNGCPIISGQEMFVHQAAEQFRLFTGSKPETDLMKNILQCNS